MSSCLLIIGAITFALMRIESTDRPELEPVAPAQPNLAAPIAIATPVAVTGDASVTHAVAPQEVVLHVTKGGVTAVGARIELEAPDGGRVGGTVDTFGNVTLPLEAGTWTVREPRTEPRTLVIAATTRSADLVVLAAQVLSGVVIDHTGLPVPLAMVFAKPPNGEGWSTSSGPDGAFTLAAPTDARLAVFAVNGSQRSIDHFLWAPQSGLSLTLQPTFTYELSAVGPVANTARLVVQHGFGMKTCIASCKVTVPEGEVTASAVSFNGSQIFSARVVERVTANSERRLKLEPAPPLSGKLLDAKGAPLPGAQLRLNRFNLSNEDYLTGAMPRPMGFDNTVLTDSHGAFTVAFPAENFPIWILTADAPHVLERRVLVVPGDGPIELRTK